ncbi:hypothetical protein ACFV4K_00345 [Nocardia sp. NPDC059764]|uniref:hypothetical protein n=1 Tax=Nocardia sp. NPDC059764 TaxID=3346939 RepID=UPI0036631332
MRNPYIGNCGHDDSDHSAVSGLAEVGFSTRYDADRNAIVFSVCPDVNDGHTMVFTLEIDQAIALHDLFDNALLDAIGVDRDDHDGTGF